MVGQVASFLFKLQVDPKDDEALAMSRKYRTSTQQLEKVIYDEVRMPKQERKRWASISSRWRKTVFLRKWP